MFISIFVSFLSVMPIDADAGVFKKGYIAFSAEYYDYEYSKWLWDNLTSFDKISAEEKKYSKQYDPWYASYKRNKDAAMIALDPLPKDGPVKRGYDLQLAYDEWRDNVYERWIDSYKNGHEKRTFDQYLQYIAQKRGACAPGEKRTYLDMCGPYPDWRSPEDKMAEQKMMAEADKKNSASKR